MSRTYQAPGDVLTHINGGGSAILSGSLVAIGPLLGIASGDIAAGESGEVMVVGVHRVSKVSAAVCNAGDVIAADISAGGMQTAAFAGSAGDITGGAVCLADAGAGETEVLIRLQPGAGTLV